MLRHFQGSILLTQKDEFVFKHHAGSARPGIKIDDATLFRTASVTKPIVGAAFLKLCHEKDIPLSTKLSAILPDFNATWASKITLLQILTHQSGIGKYEDMKGHDEFLASHKSPHEILKFIEKSELKFTPNSDYLYSPPAYWLLGKVIEEISDMSISHFFKTQVFDPIQMNASFFPTQGTMDDLGNQYENLALAYTVRAGELTYVKSKRDIVFSNCSGAIISTLGDLYNWCRAFMQTDYLSQTLKELMLKPNRNHYGIGI